MYKHVEQTSRDTTVRAILAHLLLLGLSLLTIILLQDALGLIANGVFWVLIIAWLALLPFFVLRPANIFALQVARVHPLTPQEEEYLNPLWREVTESAKIPPHRYLLRVAEDHRPSTQRDAGLHVVTVSRGSIHRLTPTEMRAIFAQSLGRHVGLRASIFRLAAWMALPGLLALALGWVAWIVMKGIRSTAKEFNSAGDRVNPKTDFQAGVGLGFYAVALALWILLIVIFVFLVGPTLFALATTLLFTSLARWSEYDADQFAIRLGYGPQLAASLRRFLEVEEHSKSWRRVFSLHAPLSARIDRIEKAAI